LWQDCRREEQIAVILRPGANVGELDVEVLQPRSACAVVVLQGEHDLATARELEALLALQVGGNDLVVVDLSVVEFIDSSVLGVLVRADRLARGAGKRFRLQVGTAAIVKRVLEISGLLNHFEWASSREDALA
jgi:anti-anti-sigma factor